MKNIFRILIIAIIASACEEPQENSALEEVNWKERKDFTLPDSLVSGKSYLSVYTAIYSLTEHKTHSLTSTISMRNMNSQDSIYIHKAQFYNTAGDLIRTYFDKPIFIKPNETVEIVIDELDNEGGTGANFVFEWSIKPQSNEPFFEGVMISTSGQQGLSFTTQGIKLVK